MTREVVLLLGALVFTGIFASASYFASKQSRHSYSGWETVAVVSGVAAGFGVVFTVAAFIMWANTFATGCVMVTTPSQPLRGDVQGERE